MKKELENIKVGDLTVKIELEEREHQSVHAILFTATCGDSLREGTMTFSLAENETVEHGRKKIQDYAEVLAKEAATHERTRIAKQQIFKES